MLYRQRLAWGALALLLAATVGVAQEPIRPDPVRSGRDFQAPETRAMQDDDGANPGMLWVARGRALWDEAVGAARRSCASCHGRADETMRGVAAQYPRVDPSSGRLLNLELRIQQCRGERQDAPVPRFESDELLALTAYVAHQSRGMPVAVSVDGAARPFFDAGRAAYFQRIGQLNLACTHCHDANWGRMLRGDRLSQGHGNAYPAYRLDWQAVGSLQRRLRFCNTGVRAEPHPFGAAEYVALELYLAWRAKGLTVESPAVRR
ncbi:MAG: sulfur oxidation c-type cytochrome SoxA [Alphaproteobacteria bacterium]|nr:sulfur oxidation c-type cytochrome SoxA [Alphaproteobacteria bacterium]